MEYIYNLHNASRWLYTKHKPYIFQYRSGVFAMPTLWIFKAWLNYSID